MSYQDMVIANMVSGLDPGVAEVTLTKYHAEQTEIEGYITAIDSDITIVNTSITSVKAEMEILNEDSDEYSIKESELRQLEQEKDNLINARADYRARLKEIDIAVPYLEQKVAELEDVRQQETQIYSDDEDYEVVEGGEKNS